MAYALNPDDQQNPTAGGQAAGPQAPTTSSGAPAPSKTPTGNAKDAQPGTAPSQSFQNISAYLSANQPQVQQEGQTIAGNLNTQANTTTADINKAATSFEGDVNAATKSFTPDQAAAFEKSPSTFAANPSDTATFQALYKNSSPYAGPTDFTSSKYAAPLATETAGDKALGSSLGNFSGIEAYLRGIHPSSTAGTAALDTTLLRGTPEALTPIDAAAANLTGTSATLATRAAQEDAAAKAAADTTGAGAQRATAAGQTAQKSLQDALNGRVQALNQPNPQLLTTFLSGQTDPGTLEALGLDPAMAEAYGAMTPEQRLNAASYLLPAAAGQTQTARQVASPQEIANEQAFEKLFGSSYASPFA